MFKQIRPEAVKENVWQMIGNSMLLTACTSHVDEEGKIITGRPNTMTVSWGGAGVLWNKNVVTVYVRPSRYTKEIIDQSDTFSLCLLPEKYKQALNYCGTHSGRDGDKFGPAKLHLEYYNGTPWIKEAKLVFICRKLYVQEFSPYSFADEKILKQNYKNDDFHTMYIGEIIRVSEDKR